MSQLLPSLAELEQHAQAQPEFASWRQGYGPFEHKLETQAAVFRLAHQLVQAGHQADLAAVYRLLQAIDRIASAALWLVVHMTYAERVRLDGSALAAEDFHFDRVALGPHLVYEPGTSRPRAL